MKKQYYYLQSSGDVDLFDGDPGLTTEDSADVPLALHANLHVCWELTDYLLYLLRVSRRKKSTVNTYANKLALFVRFLDTRKLTFAGMTNTLFIEFRNSLMRHDNKRSHNEINSLLQRAFRFLLWLQFTKRAFGERQVIDFDDPDAQVTLYRKIVTYKDARGRHKQNTVIDHPALLRPNPKKKRHPIAEVSINQLWSVIPKISPNTYRRARAELLLMVLEATGGRREEVDNITVTAMLAAEKTGKVVIDTVKWRERPRTREIPIPTELIKRARRFISFDRAAVVKAAIKRGSLKKDHGLLFTTAHGQIWSEKSITEEIAELRALAGLKVPAHPHLFRNRKLTVCAHEFSAANGFMDDRGMVTAKLLSIGGQTTPEGVAPYIDSEFQERPAWKASDEALRSREEISLSRHRLERIHAELRGAGTERTNQLAQEIIDVLNALLRHDQDVAAEGGAIAQSQALD